MNELNPLWLLLALPIFFVGIWAFVCQLLSVLSGWRSLAKAYPRVGIPEGELLRGRSARIGLTSYRGSLSFTASSLHLHLAPLAIFRFGHAPLSVPWSEIAVERRQGLLVRNVELRFSRVPRVRILIDAGIGEALAQASVGRLVVPPPDD